LRSPGDIGTGSRFGAAIQRAVELGLLDDADELQARWAVARDEEDAAAGFEAWNVLCVLM
jgi:hypothetical protein